MLTAGIASIDAKSSSSLHATLEQTGQVSSVVEWLAVSRGSWQLGPDEKIPDVVLLDLSVDPDPYFRFAAQLRRLRSDVHVIACSLLEAQDSELLLQAMRMGVQDFLSRPIDLEKLRGTLDRFLQQAAEHEVIVRDRMFLVMGAKGGVGTSTVAINLAAQLAQAAGKRVGLIDLGFPLGHDGILLDLRPKFGVRDAVENLERLDSHLLSGLLTRHKSGLDVLSGTSHAEEWIHLVPAGIARLVNVAQALLDYVIVDFGASYSPDWKPVLEVARSVLFVAEASVLSLWSLERHLTDVIALGIDPSRVRIVVNRWQRRDDEALARFEKNAKRTIFARLPNDFSQVSEATNLGVPLSRNHNDPLTHKYRKLAVDLAGLKPSEDGKRGALLNLFGRK